MNETQYNWISQWNPDHYLLLMAHTIRKTYAAFTHNFIDWKNSHLILTKKKKLISSKRDRIVANSMEKSRRVCLYWLIGSIKNNNNKNLVTNGMLKFHSYMLLRGNWSSLNLSNNQQQQQQKNNTRTKQIWTINEYLLLKIRLI